MEDDKKINIHRSRTIRQRRRRPGPGQTYLQRLIAHLRESLQHSSPARHRQSRPRLLPFVRVHTRTVARADSRLSYGFVHGPGVYETTLTRPDLYSHYYLEQFRLLLKNHGTTLEVGTSAQPIPVHFSFAENDHVEGNLSAERRQLMRDVFDLPDLSVMDDGIANGTYEPRAAPTSRCRCSPARASITRCTACATTPAPCPSGSRTSCCSPTTSSTSTNSCAWAMS
jgi:hypothetical protein